MRRIFQTTFFKAEQLSVIVYPVQAKRSSVFLTVLTFVLSVFLSTSGFSQNVTVNPGAITYATLKEAFDAINLGTHTGIITIDIVGNTSETATASLNASGVGSASYSTVLIQPSGGVIRTISGSIALPLVELNGADNVTINGLNSGGNALTFSNASTSATAGTSTLRFINDASDNVITNCTILGSSTGTAAQTGVVSSPAAATILFAGSTGATGNDNNTISNCNIGEEGANLPVVAISSAGQSASITNDNNSITANNIFNFYGNAGANGIAIGSNSSAFTISSNKFYQTASRSGLASANYLECIFISTSTGGGYVVNNNIIGYATSGQTGMLTNNGGRFIGIDLTAVAATPVSEIQGNTINGINWTTASGAATAGASPFNGIIVKAGGVNVGTTTGNTIGAISGTGSASSNIFITTTTTGTGIFPIYLTSGTACTISNNKIGAIATGGTAAIGYLFSGIAIAGSGGHTVLLNNVGNSTTGGIALGIVGTSTSVSTAVGIDCAATGANTIGSSGNSNNIQNINLNAVATNVFIGIRNTGAGTVLNINYNTIKGIVFGATSTTHASTFTGIISTGAVTTTISINNNSLGVPGTNLITYSLTGTAATGALTGISCTSATAATTHSIQSNDFQGISYTFLGSGAHTYINLTGATAASNVATIASNTFTNLNVNTSGTVTFIAHGYSISSTGQLIINSNSIVTAFNRGGASGSVFLTSSNSISGTGSINNYTSNNFSNITVAGTSTITGFNNTDGGTGSTKTITGNTFSNWTGGTGTINTMNFSYWNGVSSLSTNTITNITGQGAITAVTMGTSSNAASLITVGSNTINNLSSTGTGGTVTGISCSNASTIINITDNTIHTLSSTGASSTVSGIIIGGATTTNVFQNIIYGLTGSGTASPVCNGISVGGGVTVKIYRNKIYDLTETAALSALSPAVNGIVFSGGTNLTVNNNLVGNLTAPAANLTDAIRGISVTTGTSSTTYNVYYNTVFLNASSSGTNFGTTGIYHVASTVSTTATLHLRNNIIVNNSTPAGSGLAVAFRRSAGTAGTLANYGSTSNNNLFFTGVLGGSANQLIYSDGVSIAQSLAAYKGGVFTAGTIAPRDAGSVTENVSSTPGVYFQSFTGSASTFLHMVGGLTTQVESGAVNISGITDDYDAEVRQGNGGYVGTGTAPDIGADEFAGVAADLTGPVISYTALTNTLCTTSPSFSATITDASGINTMAGTKPRVWFRKSTNLNVLPGTNDNTTDGWKYFETTDGMSPFSFTLDYTLIFGGVAAGDVIQYFVVAQDNATIPNLGINSGTFAMVPPTVALNAGAFPVTGANSFNILAAIPVSVTIGAMGTYPSLSDAATGLFAAINAGGLGGNTVVTILDATIAETGAVSLNHIAYACGGPYTLTIKPDVGVTPVLSGSSATALIDLNGADNVIFDGSNNGTSTTDMTIRNTGTGATIRFINDATANVIKNTKVESQNTSTTSGTIVFSTTTGTLGNSSNTLNNCDIRDRSDMAGVPAIGVYSSGSGGVLNASNSISGCRIFNWTNTGVLIASVGAGNGWTINPTSFYQTATRSTSLTAISILGGSGHTISGNSIGGSAPDRSGSPMVTNGSSATFTGIGLAVGTAATTNVQGNLISNLNISGGSSQTFKGINITSGNVNVGTVAGNILGGATSAFDTIRTSYDSDLIENSGAGIVNIENNTIGNVAYYRASADRLFGIRGTAGTVSIKNNIVRDFKSNSSSTTFSFFPGGIWLATGVAGATVDGNQVYNIEHTNAGTSAYTIAGMYISGVSSTGMATTIAKNKIYNIAAAGTGTTTSPRIWGLYIASGSATYSNNMIALGSTVSNESRIHGIEDLGTGTNNYFFNTISVSGTTGSGSNNSYAFRRSSTATVSILSNIFSNIRTGGTGFHVAIANTATATGWSASASNYNDLYTITSSTLGQWLGSVSGNNRDFAGWQASQGAGTPGSGGDANAINVAPVFTSTTDLHLTPSNGSLDGFGTPAGGILTDIDGDTRNMTTPDMGADEFMAASCTVAMGGMASITGMSSFCTSGSTTLTATGYSFGIGSTYEWEKSTDNFVMDSTGTGQSNPAAFVTGTITGTTYYRLRVQCATGMTTDFSNIVSVTIVAPPTATLSPSGTVDLCPPVSSQLLTSSTNASMPSYVWKKDGVTIGGEINPTYPATATGVYTVVITDAATTCSTTSIGTTIIFNPLPSTVIIVPSSLAICEDDAAQLLTATGGQTIVSATSGTGANTSVGNTTTSTLGPNPLQIYYGGDKQQWIYTASELSALGLDIGSEITAIKLNLVTADNTLPLQSLEVKMKNTSTSSFPNTTSWETGLTVVRTAANYTPAVGLNTINLNSNFVWNGSNLVIEISYSNNNGGTSGSVYNTAKHSPTGFSSTIFYRADNATAATISAYTGTASFIYNDRNDVTFEFLQSTSFTWTPNGPGSGLFTDAGATMVYSGAVSDSVYTTPSVTTDYVATATSSAGCTNADTITVTVNPTPTITFASSITVCSGITMANLTYTGISGNPDEISIDYDLAAEAEGFTDVINASLPLSPVVLIIPGAAAAGMYTATVTVRNSVTGCISNTTTISIEIIAAPDAGIVSGSTPLCITASDTYTTSGDPGGIWSSTNPSVASVDPMTGVVLALAVGTTDITYTVSNACGGPVSDFETLTVTPIEVLNNNDSGPGSLRDIIACVGSGATITFSPALAGDTILLTTGEIPINKNITLAGLGTLNLSLSGNHASRIFHVQSGSTLTLQSMTLKDASALTNGGAVFVEGNLVLQNIILQNNFENGLPKSLTVTTGAQVIVIGTVEFRI